MLSVMQCPPGQGDVCIETDQIVPGCVLESFALIKWSLYYRFFYVKKSVLYSPFIYSLIILTAFGSYPDIVYL